MSEIPDWAIQRANTLYDAENPKNGYVGDNFRRAFGRYIAAHEEPPVDPLLIEARKLFLLDHNSGVDLWDSGVMLKDGAGSHLIMNGRFDLRPEIGKYMGALRRGIEIERERQHALPA